MTLISTLKAVNLTSGHETNLPRKHDRDWFPEEKIDLYWGWDKCSLSLFRINKKPVDNFVPRNTKKSTKYAGTIYVRSS